MDGFEKYLRNRARVNEFNDYWVDRDAAMQCTVMVWTGMIDIDNITIIDAEDALWLESD